MPVAGLVVEPVLESVSEQVHDSGNKPILVDGHNRHEICTRHNIQFKTVEKTFDNRESVMDWIDSNQLGRRNLSPDSFKLLLGRRYNRVKQKHGAESGGRGNQHGVVKPQIGDLPEPIKLTLSDPIQEPTTTPPKPETKPKKTTRSN